MRDKLTEMFDRMMKALFREQGQTLKSTYWLQKRRRTL